MIKVNAIGDTCPIPVIKTKNAIKQMNGEGVVEVMVDNEIAVQNLTKMAKQKQYACRSEKLSGEEYRVVITVTKGGSRRRRPDRCPGSRDVSCAVRNAGCRCLHSGWT